MFKRKPRGYLQSAGDFFWPRGGWKRATQYVIHRLRRLPDPPHRIGRGVAAGTFVSFTPFFGLHFILAFTTAWLLRGNLLAAAIGTFVGNPVTTPFIAVLSVGLGRWMMGLHGHIGPQTIVSEIARASGEVAGNVLAVLTPEREAHWNHLATFLHEIFIPYLVGGLIPGLIAALLLHYLTIPLVEAYHRRRAETAARRAERRRLSRTPGTP